MVPMEDPVAVETMQAARKVKATKMPPFMPTNRNGCDGRNAPDGTFPEFAVAGAEDTADQKGQKAADCQCFHVKCLKTDEKHHAEKYINCYWNQGHADSAVKLKLSFLTHTCYHPSFCNTKKPAHERIVQGQAIIYLRYHLVWCMCTHSLQNAVTFLIR